MGKFSSFIIVGVSSPSRYSVLVVFIGFQVLLLSTWRMRERLKTLSVHLIGENLAERVADYVLSGPK